MAEDKRIRINVDYSELDQLREKIRSLTFELNRMGENFGGITPDRFQSYANQVVDLQEQALRSISSGDNQFRVFDRAWGRFSSGYQALNPDWRSRLTSLEPLSPGASDRVTDTTSNRGLWGRITDFLSRIANSLEKENRDRENGEVPIGNTPQSKPQNIPQPEHSSDPSQQPERIDWGEALKGFKFPTSIGGLLGMFAGGLILDQIGQMIGEQVRFSAAQANIGDEFQREINEANNPLLNKFTFGIPGAIAQRKMHNYQVARQMDRSVVGFAQMSGQAYDSSVGALFRLGGDLEDGVSFQKDMFSESTTSEAQAKRAKTVQVTGGLYSPTVGAGFSPVTGADYVEDSVFGTSSSKFGARGRSNWASKTLGLDMGEYLEKYTQFARAGLTAENTFRESGLNQLMIAQRYRGLSDSDIEGIQRATRFSSNRTGAQVTSALDEQLQRYARNVLGYGDFNTNLYVSTMLPEMIQRFSSFADSALSVKGSYDAAGILRQMSSIQNATGAQGTQLERYQDALMGRGVSQDDVTQALLLRTARQLNPDGSYTDLMADVESFRAGDNSKVAKKFYDQIVKITGGKGEQFRTILKSVYGDRLSWNDVNRLERGELSADELFGNGLSVGSRYTSEQASRTVSATERSGAETRNRQAEEGYNDIYGKMGQSLAEILANSQISKDINDIATGFKDVLLAYVAQRLEETNKNSPFEGPFKVSMPVQVDVTGE